MSIEIRETRCTGPCGEMKLIQVAVQRNGAGREIAVGQAVCDECKRAALS
jgi:hypothetical protein